MCIFKYGHCYHRLWSESCTFHGIGNEWMWCPAESSLEGKLCVRTCLSLSSCLHSSSVGGSGCQTLCLDFWTLLSAATLPPSWATTLVPLWPPPGIKASGQPRPPPQTTTTESSAGITHKQPAGWAPMFWCPRALGSKISQKRCVICKGDSTAVTYQMSWAALNSAPWRCL